MGLLGGGALEGSLAQFSLPDILALLSLTKKSGGLHIRHSEREGVVYFELGAVTGATSDLSRQALARRLVGRGLVPDEALADAATELMSGESKGLARILRDNEVVSEEMMSEVASEQATDAVFDLLRWTEGDFAFHTDEANPDDLGVSLATTEVVEEAQRRVERWSELTRTIPAPDAVPSVNVRSGDQEISVNAEEWGLMVLIDGQRSVRELGECTGLGDFQTMGLLSSLIERNLVSLRRGGSNDANDSVAALLRRQELVSAIEQGEPGKSGKAGARAVTPRVPVPPRGAPAQPTPVQPPVRQAAFSPTPARRPGLGARPGAKPGVGLGTGRTQPAPRRSGIDPQVNQDVVLRLIDGLRKA